MISEMEFKKHLNVFQLAHEQNVKNLRYLVVSHCNKKQNHVV